MTRLLVVAYYFPPLGGAGTQRFAKFCKYLPEYGVEPVVLTAGSIETNSNAPHDDPTLMADVPAIVERVDEPWRGTFARRVMKKLRFYLDEDEWADTAETHAVEMARRLRPEAVITTLSPFACYRIGMRLKRELGLPWLVDLRDPWSLDGWRWYRTRVHAAYDLARMREALRTADFVIANVPEAKKAFVALGAAPERTVVIPNGFDEVDFAGQAVAAAPSDDRFHLVHVGTFHAVDAAEGLTADTLVSKRHRQIAPLGRTGYYLLHALASLRNRAPDAYGRMRVDLYGLVDATHRALIERLGVGDVVTAHGYVPHRESIVRLCAADAVFVPLHGVPAGERALVVPGKLYEALASERPVLAAVPPGDAADLVQALAAGSVVAPTDAEQLSRELEALVRAKISGAPRSGCRRRDLAMFSRRHLTSLLAAVVKGAVRREAVDVADPWQAVRRTGGGGGRAETA
ncbi:MAG: glycosyltransferase [Planctomycetota bacterium]